MHPLVGACGIIPRTGETMQAIRNFLASVFERLARAFRGGGSGEEK